MRYGNSVWLGVAAVTGVLLCAGATWSEPARGGACSVCDQRVAALEVRVARLEKRVAALQARSGAGTPKASAAATPPKTAKKGAAATTPAAPQTVPGSNNVKTFPPVAGCSPPYTIDADGIQQPKPGCEDMQNAVCDPPYVIDAQGLRHPKAACLR